MKYSIIVLLFVCTTSLFGQKESIEITDETSRNRLFLYATNTSEVDLDVTMTVEGSGFRKSTRKPRAYRVPAASKVQIMSLVVERGKTARYTYELEVTDSLSRRALRKPATAVKIDPKKPILLYLTNNCTTCEQMIQALDSSYYNYRTLVLEEKPEIKETLVKVFAKTVTPYDSITNPIINLGGKLYSEIGSYDELLAKLNEQ